MTTDCPSCLTRGIRPSVVHSAAGRLVSAFDCASCGHQWTTRRLLTAYTPPTAHRPIRKAV